jgi:Dicarboxylate transport
MRSAVGLAVSASLCLLLYAAAPVIVARLGPLLAERFGLSSLEVDIDHPGLHGVALRRLALGGDGFELTGLDADVTYSWRSLRRGELESIAFGALEIVRLAPADAAEPPAQPATGLRVPALPVARLQTEHLVLRLPGLGFTGTGRAEIGDGRLSVSLDGIEPEAASRFSLTASLQEDGRYSARFGERGEAQREFLRVQGLFGTDTVSVDADADLGGFALTLLTAMAGLPEGTGTLSGVMHTDLPWPIPEALDWRALNIGVPVLGVEWRSKKPDLAVEKISGTLAMTGGRVAGSLSGRIAFRSPDGTVDLQLPPGHRFSLDGSSLAGSGEVVVRAAKGDDRIEATVHTYSLTTGPEHSLSIDAGISAGVRGFVIAGGATAALRLSSLQSPAGSGRLTFTGDVDAGGQSRKASISAAYRFTAGNWQLQGKASSGIFRDVPYTADLDLATGRGSLTAVQRFEFSKPLAAALVGDWQEAYDLDAGSLDAGLELRWGEPTLPLATLSLKLDDGRAHFNKDTATGISGAMTVLVDAGTDAGMSWTLRPTSLRVGQVDVGLLLSDVTMDIAVAGDRVEFGSVDAELLGGHARTGAFSYAVDEGTAAFPVTLEDIDLQQILALEGEDVTGSGRLDAVLPVTIRGNEPRVDGGTFRARPPGGRITVRPSFAGLSSQPGLYFAMLALKDFTYTDLSGELDYDESGDMKLAVHLKGNNPTVEKGRPIQYNLTINENIPQLLESLRLSDRVTEGIGRDVVN